MADHFAGSPGWLPTGRIEPKNSGPGQAWHFDRQASGAQDHALPDPCPRLNRLLVGVQALGNIAVDAGHPTPFGDGRPERPRACGIDRRHQLVQHQGLEAELLLERSHAPVEHLLGLVQLSLLVKKVGQHHRMTLSRRRQRQQATRRGDGVVKPALRRRPPGLELQDLQPRIRTGIAHVPQPVGAIGHGRQVEALQKASVRQHIQHAVFRQRPPVLVMGAGTCLRPALQSLGIHGQTLVGGQTNRLDGGLECVAEPGRLQQTSKVGNHLAQVGPRRRWRMIWPEPFGQHGTVMSLTWRGAQQSPQGPGLAVLDPP